MQPLHERLPGIRSGRAIVFAALVAGVTPPERMTVAEWAEKHRKVAAESGSPYPGAWDNKLVPYGVEIQECMSLTDPCREVVFVKSAQVAGTEFGVNLFGYVVDQQPSPIVIVLPTIEEGNKYERLKLQPTIEATPALRHKIKTDRSRSREGSTMTFKRFRGGFAQVTGANSSTGLQMISGRILIAEEISEWPDDVGNRGDPLVQAETRLTAWSLRKPKRYYGSTPKIAPMCRITKKFKASDQRRYYVACPHCGHHQVLRWQNMKWRNDTAPIGAFMVCAAHGCVIEHYEKPAMVAAGVWIKTYPDDGAEPGPVIAPDDLQRYRDRASNGREPGFHIWQAYSPFVSWDDTVAAWIEAKGNPLKEKTFTQQRLGEAWEERGETPDHEKLFLRRETYPLQTVPPGALVLTGMADVQGYGIVWSVYGWGIGMTGWLVDTGIVHGDPALAETWLAMDAVVSRRYETWNGSRREIERFGVDAGYQSNMVYLFSRKRAHVYALDGRGGHLHPTMGVPKKVDVSLRGKTVKGGVLLWPTGTWPLKSLSYAMLEKTIKGPDEYGNWPLGCIHYPDACDEDFFKELTAEFLEKAENKKTGQEELVWKKIGGQANEQLDILVGNLALSAHLGLHDYDSDKWQRLAADRDAEPQQAQLDLARLWSPDPEVEADKAAVAAERKKRRREKAARLGRMNRSTH